MMAENQDRVGTGARIAVLGVLGIVALAVLIPGVTVYWMVIEDWAADGGGFHDLDGAINWIFGVCAAVAVAAGLVAIGVMLRLLSWQGAKLGSLALSVLSVAFVIATYWLFSDTNTSSDSLEIVFLQACCIGMLLLAALPPFLHWALAKPARLPAPTEPRP